MSIGWEGLCLAKITEFRGLLFILGNGHDEFAGGKVLFRVQGALGHLLIPARGNAGKVVLSEAPPPWGIFI